MTAHRLFCSYVDTIFDNLGVTVKAPLICLIGWWNCSVMWTWVTVTHDSSDMSMPRIPSLVPKYLWLSVLKRLCVKREKGFWLTFTRLGFGRIFRFYMGSMEFFFFKLLSVNEIFIRSYRACTRLTDCTWSHWLWWVLQNPTPYFHSAPNPLRDSPLFSSLGWLSLESAPLSGATEVTCDIAKRSMKVPPSVGAVSRLHWIKSPWVPGPAAPAQGGPRIWCEAEMQCLLWKLGRKPLATCLLYLIPSFPSRAVLLSQSRSRMMQRLFELSHEAFLLWDSGLSMGGTWPEHMGGLLVQLPFVSEPEPPSLGHGRPDSPPEHEFFPECSLIPHADRLQRALSSLLQTCPCHPHSCVGHRSIWDPGHTPHSSLPDGIFQTS